MQLLVLAGGFGTRLRPTVLDVPKALAPVNDEPFLKFQMDSWISQGIKDFIFLLHFEAQLIINFLESWNQLNLNSGINIRYLIEEKPLGTGGSVANAVKHFNLTSSFLVANADTWLDSGVISLVQSNAPAIAITQVPDASRYGSVTFDKSLLVTAFVEKERDDNWESCQDFVQVSRVVVPTAGAGQRTGPVATIVARRARRVFRVWGAAGPSRQLTTRRARCEGHSRRVRPCAHREHHSCVLSSRAHACTHPAHERAPRCCVQQQVRGAHPRTTLQHGCVRTRVRTASTMRAQGGAHGRREGTCCCSCLLRPSCSWTPDLRLHLTPAGCSCVDYPEPSPEIRSRKWVK